MAEVSALIAQHTCTARTLTCTARKYRCAPDAHLPRTHTCPERKCRGVPGSAGECRCLRFATRISATRRECCATQQSWTPALRTVQVSFVLLRMRCDAARPAGGTG